MNTLAVLEAGATVGPRDLAAAMTAIAFCYTIGSMAGPALSGTFMRYLSGDGLMLSAGVAGGGFLLASSLLKPKPAIS